jgi:DNA-binding NarL/FixJ family response regulator
MRLVVAEDSVLLREGLAALLGEAGFQVVGVAGDGEEALSLVRRTRPGSMDDHRRVLAVLSSLRSPVPPRPRDRGGRLGPRGEP